MMQNLAKDEAGNIWEVDSAGNAVRLAQPAPAPAGRVFSLPQSPKEARQEARADEDQQLQRDAAERADATAQRQAAAAERAAEAAARPTDAQVKAQDNASAKLKAARALQRQLAEMKEIYARSFKGKGPVQSVGEMLPSDDAERFRAIARSMRADLKPLIRGPAEGTFTEGDQALLDQLIPDPRSFDASNEQTFAQLESRIKDTLAEFGGNERGQRADNEVPDPTNKAGLKPPAPGEIRDGDPSTIEQMNGPPDPYGRSIANQSARIVRDPRVAAQVDALINNGASIGTINAVLKRQNFPTLNPVDFSRAKDWMRKNPGKRYYGSDPTRLEDLSLMEKAAGSDTGAFLAHMGNMGSAGLAGALAGEEGKGALDAMSANSPTASFAGGLLGGTTGMLAAEAALAARAPAALAGYVPRAADAVYGAATGFNSAREGEGGMGALMGGGLGLAGGVIGERAMRGLGSATRGIRNDAVQLLRDSDVPLTVGQAVGNSGRIGAGVKKMEDALTSVPFVGNMVEARRMEGLEGFNREAFQRAAAPGAKVTAPGAEGMGQLRQGVQDAYGRVLDPVRIDANDPTFLADIAAVNAAARRIPPVNGAQDAAMASLQHRIDGAIDPVTDQMTGRGFQEAYRGLARTGRERAAGDYGHEVGQVMREGQDALGSVLERQNPGAFEAFIEANAANRRMNVLGQALGPAGNQADELITPAQLNRADIRSTSRLEGRVNSAAGNRPFYDLATAGQAVLPSRLPDSGTWTRAIVGGGGLSALGGAGYFGGTDAAATGGGLGLGATLMLAAGGSRPAQRAMTSLLLDRPDAAIRLGEILRQQARLGGTAGAGVGANLAIGY